MQDFLLIGAVLKPQGVRGECKIRSYASDIDMFSGWTELFLKSGNGFDPVACEVTRIHDGFVYARLGGCTDATGAEKYRGADLYIDRGHAAAPEAGSDLIADLIGCEAVDENGNTVGVLDDVLQYGPVDTWVFRTPEGTMMVPALLSVFPAVDTAARRITVLSDRLSEVAVLDH